MRRALLAAAVAVMLLGRAVAQEQPGRPQPLQELFFTEVVYPQQRHEVQLTLGSYVDRSRADKAALAPFSIEYGLTNRWQIEGSWDGYTEFETRPLRRMRTAKMSVGTKGSVMNIAHSRVHAAVGLDVEFTRSGALPEGEGESGTEYEPYLSMAVDVTHALTVFGSAGLSLETQQVVDLTEGPPPDDPGTLSGGALVRVHRVTLATEYTSRSDQAPWRLNGSPLVTPSVTFHPGHEWELAAGMPIGIRAGTHRPGIALHFVKEF